jgi:redox-sensitive bicupin YhaK (pirin superfamily)
MTAIDRVIDARTRDLGGFSVGRVLPTIGRRFVGPFVFFDHMYPGDAGELALDRIRTSTSAP